MDFEKFYKENASRTVLVIGDLVLEEYIHGKVAGFSTDGPVPEVHTEERSLYPSSAGYAAIQLQDLGLQVRLCSVVGNDPSAGELLKLLTEKGINISQVIRQEGYVTSKQTHIRVYGDHYPAQDILKVRPAAAPSLSQNIVEKLLLYAVDDLNDVDAVVFVDRTAGLVTPSLIKSIKAIAQGLNIPLIGDSDQNTSNFRGFQAVTLNEQEAARLLGVDRLNWQKEGDRLKSELGCEKIFLTLGNRGLVVLQLERSDLHIPTESIPIFDVSGAGETVLACVAAGLAAKLSLPETGQLANTAAGLIVTRPGLTDVTIEEIAAFDRKRAAGLLTDKVKPLDSLKKLLDQEKSRGRKIVWTNGCYDIMHAGHILYLEKAKELGDLLVVGLNSDASVRKSKGPNRPIVEENQRAKLLASLSFVDYVIIFDDQSPKGIIDILKPDVYAKGGDYTIDTINQVERRLVEGYGGEIAILPGVEGMSTSNIIEKIVEVHKL